MLALEAVVGRIDGRSVDDLRRLAALERVVCLLLLLLVAAALFALGMLVLTVIGVNSPQFRL
jgi:hypothetical protein